LETRNRSYIALAALHAMAKIQVRLRFAVYYRVPDNCPSAREVENQ
jgi:hypothetical protein